MAWLKRSRYRRGKPRQDHRGLMLLLSGARSFLTLFSARSSRVRFSACTLGVGWMVIGLVVTATHAEEPLNARELYGRAAAALAAKDVPLASAELSRLVEQFSTDDLAPLAALRLAECQLAQGKSVQAIELLLKWMPQLSTSKHTQLLEPTAELRAEYVLARAYMLMENWDSVVKLVETRTARTTSSPSVSETEHRMTEQLKQLSAQATLKQEQSRGSVLRNASEQIRSKNFEAAAKALASIQPADLSPAWLWRYRVLLAQCSLGQGENGQALEQLDRVDLAQLSDAERNTVRMVCLDAALAAGQLSRAQSEVDHLADMAAKDDHLGPTIALRAVEVAMLRKDRETADRLARTARAAFPKFAALHEFDLLLARNALARVEFAEARRILESIIQAPAASDPTAVPRAHWLLGESYFLSRDYARAIVAYGQVIDAKTAQWTESALMQRGKCHELLGNPAAAIADYRRLVNDFQSSCLQTAAQARLVELEGIERSAAKSTNNLTR